MMTMSDKHLRHIDLGNGYELCRFDTGEISLRHTANGDTAHVRYLAEHERNFVERTIVAAAPSAMEGVDEREFRALEALLLGNITCSDDLPENERPASLNARLLFGHIYRLREAALEVVRTMTEDFGGPEAERHARALTGLATVLVRPSVGTTEKGKT